MAKRACMPGAVLLLALAGCGGEGGQASEAGDRAAQTAADRLFFEDHLEWRAERRERLVAPDGWTGLVGLHWVELPAHYVGSSRGSGIRLAKGPPRLGLLQQERGRLFFTPERGVALTVDGAPLARRVELHTDRSDHPTVLGFDDGLGEISVVERGKRRALRVRHQEAPARTAFAGLDYWNADPGWRIEGRFVPHVPARTLEIATITGGVEAMPNPGAVEFEREGRSFRLEAIGGGDGGLFLIMADRTSGQGSYGAGRYLDAPAPDDEGRVVLDFNRAYNPPCAFTDYATCPLPPLENRLDLAITAGEKAYARPAG